MAKKNRHKKKTTSCGAVVWRVRERLLEILLIKQFDHKDSWGIPKGHINESETLEQCGIREVREETGVAIALGVRLPDMHIDRNNEDKTVVSWLARPTGDETPKHDDPDSEVADARWFGIDELPKIHVYQRPLITAAVQSLLRVLDNVESRYLPMQPPEPDREKQLP